MERRFVTHIEDRGKKNRDRADPRLPMGSEKAKVEAGQGVAFQESGIARGKWSYGQEELLECSSIPDSPLPLNDAGLQEGRKA